LSKAGDNKIRLLVTGGGTGGHLFPAVATAQEFVKQMPDTEVLFVGTRRKVDTGSLSAYGFQSENIRCYGLKGKNPLELLKALAVLPLSYVQALKIVRNFRPNIVFGVGGYVTGPVIAAVKSLGIPTVIHEQNSVPGLANRKLGKIVDKVCLSLPGSGDQFPADKIVYTGNPIRTKILELAKSDHQNQGLKKTIVILGGSQGAQPVNRLVLEALECFSKQQMATIKIVHQTGDWDAENVKDAYRNKDIEVDVQSFITDMHKVYEQADLLVTRAGATTLSEIAVLGKPAILIPYPYAADNHQEKNGNYYVLGGGAVQFKEKELTGQKLAESVLALLEDERRLSAMGSAMKKLSFPDAAEKIVACCLDVMEKCQR